jgi:hypothetical protein
VSRLFDPFVVYTDRIWFAELAVTDGWHHTALREGVWRFVSVTAPLIYDAAGKVLHLAGEIGTGSLIRIAGKAFMDGRRSVLTCKAISVIELIEPGNPFTDTESLSSAIPV